MQLFLVCESSRELNPEICWRKTKRLKEEGKSSIPCVPKVKGMDIWGTRAIWNCSDLFFLIAGGFSVLVQCANIAKYVNGKP